MSLQRIYTHLVSSVGVCMRNNLAAIKISRAYTISMQQNYRNHKTIAFQEIGLTRCNAFVARTCLFNVG